MLVSELRFWLFFAAVAALHAVLPHRWRNRLLLAASCAFYATWDWRLLALVFVSITVDYFVALRMEATADPVGRRRLLWLSLGVNLGVLATFKYLDFFLDSLVAVTTRLGLPLDPVVLHLIAPIGISFYVFRSLSYTIDVWRRDMKATSDYFDYALYVVFFPQLLAGPIERARALLPAIALPRRLDGEQVARGLVLCLIGLIKKVVIADGLAPSVDAVYGAADPSGAEVAVATWLYALQIYCDFSGYSDIARGLAKMLGFNTMLNFAQPYFAANPQEFWRRWHISLSTWLRDYLYVPLGGNRSGPSRTNVNLMATMTLGGLWHGAAWNFVLWGVYQGALLAAHRAISGGGPRRAPGRAGPVLRVLRVLLFFQFVCYGWLLFRAGSLDQIVDFTARLATIAPGQFAALDIPRPSLAAMLGAVGLLVWDLIAEARGDAAFYRRWPIALRAGLYAGMVYLLALGATTPSGAFIYFQF